MTLLQKIRDKKLLILRKNCGVLQKIILPKVLQKALNNIFVNNKKTIGWKKEKN